MNLLKKLKYFYDYTSGRYQTFIAETEEERQACHRLVQKIFDQEMRRQSSINFDNTTFIACRDTKTKRIVSTLIYVKALDEYDDSSDVFDRALAEYPKDLYPYILVSKYFGVLKEYRGTIAGFLTIFAAGVYAIEQKSTMVIGVCAPALYPLYSQFGFQALGRMVTTPAGSRIPLFFYCDRQYLQSIRSHGIKLLDKMGDKIIDEVIRPGAEWYKQFNANRPNKIATVISSAEALEIDNALISGISKAGRIALFYNAVKARYQKGDVPIVENDGGRSMALVAKGSFSVSMNGKQVKLLQSGDFFGHIPFILKTSRTATVTAQENDSEAIFISLSALERMKKQSDHLVFWQNVSKYMAKMILELRALF